MTEQQSLRILEMEVKRLIRKVEGVYGNQTQDRMTALVSVLYNTPTYHAIISDKALIGAVKGHREDVVREKLWHSMAGVNKRRAEEIGLLFNTI